MPGRLARLGDMMRRRAFVELVGDVRERLAQVRERSAELKAEVVGAMTYPAIMMIAMGGSVDATAARTGPDRKRHPEWIKAKLPTGANYTELKSLVQGQTLNTVCEEAMCPNIGECWEERTATVMILGDTCTRACRYCSVTSGKPPFAPDPEEPANIAEATVGNVMIDNEDARG